MIKIQEPTDLDDLTSLQQAYLTSQAAPIDGMWQAFAAMARHLEIRSAGEQAGYFCVNDDGLVHW